ncbi:MAG: T9SS type A sorting domain-containing protein [Bacteroidetes bacterium]|nr:T9SS type A sorting domain-containing protein [Bacteroidota bacterium]
MLRLFGCFVFVTYFISSANAQIFNAVYQAGSGASPNIIFSSGRNGQVIMHGTFSGTVDFQPDTGVLNRTAKGNTDMIVQLLDANYQAGKFVQFGSSGSKVNGGFQTQDDSGNYILRGSFNNTMDADPGPGQYLLKAKGAMDVFIIKLDSAFNFKWAGQISSKITTTGVLFKLDKNNNIYALGTLNDSTDVDPGSGVYNLYGYTTKNNYFVAKYDPSCKLLWAKKFGSTNLAYYSLAKRMELDDSANLYIMGDWSAEMDFDPDTSMVKYTANGAFDIYILKLDINGKFIWVRQIGGAGAEVSTDLICDRGRLYSSGSFQGTVDFDPGSGTYNLSDYKSIVMRGDYYLLQLTTSGDFIRANQIKTSAYFDQQIFITRDDCDGIYVSASFMDTVYTSLSSYSDFVTAPFVTGTRNIFAAKYDTTGKLKWDVTFGGSGTEQAGRILISNSNDVLINGTFENTMDFDPGPDSTKLDPAKGPCFLLSLNQKSFITTAKWQPGTVCVGEKTTLQITGNLVGAERWYLRQDSCTGRIIDSTTGVAFNVYPSQKTTYFVYGAGVCAAPGECRSAVVNTIAWGTPEITINCSDTDAVICKGTIVKFGSSVKFPGTAKYQWKLNNKVIASGVGNSAGVLELDSIKDGDSISCTMTSNAACITKTTANSNVIRFAVKVWLTPMVDITTSDSDNIICQGKPFTLQAQAINGGSTPEFNWIRNDTFLGKTGHIFKDSAIQANNRYVCQLVSTDECLTDNPVYSDTVEVTMAVPKDSSASVDACGQMVYGGQIYANDTAVVGRYSNQYGCDSSFTLHIKVHKDWSGSLDHRACRSFNYAGNIYSKSGTYDHHFTTVYGCDSLVQLKLVIDDVATDIIVKDTFLFALEDSAAYIWLDCDSANKTIPNQNSRYFTPQNNGNYSVVVMKNMCKDTSTCVLFANLYVPKLISHNVLTIYPNPGNGMIYFQSGIFVSRISLINIGGSEVYRMDNPGMAGNINVTQLPAGIYYLVAVTNSGITTVKLIRTDL